MVQASFRQPLLNETNDIIRQAQQKVSRGLADEVAALSGLSKKEIAALIGLTERALFKPTRSDFSVLISEHLLLLKQVFSHGLTVFDHNQRAFVQWLRTPLPELATPQTGYFPTTRPAPPRPLAEISTTTEPYDLIEAANQRQQRSDQPEPPMPPRPYPTPLSLLNTSTGAGLVDDVFTRIEAGVYS